MFQWDQSVFDVSSMLFMFGKKHVCKGFPCNSRDAMTNYCENKKKKGADVRKLSTDAEKMVNYVAILHDRTITVLESFLRYFGFVVGFD